MEVSMKRIMNAALALVLMSALGLMFTNDAAAQQKGGGTGKRGALFVDQNGDGVCDNFGTTAGQKLGNGSQGKGYGPGDCSGNMGQGPKDGTGYGKKSGLCTTTGVCDGSGPKGSQGRRGNK
jgi:hypothetical protein